MDSTNKSEVAITIFGIVCLLFSFCCLLLCCGGYILSKKKSKTQNQIHFTNYRQSYDAHAHIFTVEVPDTQSPNTTIIDPSYPHLSDQHPSLYETIQEPLPVVHHESNIQIAGPSTTELDKQTS